MRLKDDLIPFGFEIRRYAAENCKDLIRIHAAAFPGSMLTALGETVLRRYYEWLTSCPLVMALYIAASPIECLGFCAVSHGQTGNDFFRNNGLYLLTHLLGRPEQFLRKRFWLGIVSILLRCIEPNRIKRMQGKGTRSAGRGEARLTVIAVHPQFWGCGVAPALLLVAEKSARDHGYEQIGLTVNRDNARAIRFYQRYGWRKAAARGIGQYSMVKQL